MARPVSNDFGTEEPSNSESPCTTSSDDLFADINWPEDEADIAFDEIDFFGAVSNDWENESPKDSMSISPKSSNTSGGERTTDFVPAVSSANALKKCSGGCRFSKEVKSVLRTWFNEHKDNPYPTAEEKKELAEKTQLKQSQISLWLVNARRRHRSRKHRDPNMGTLPQTMPPPPVPGNDSNLSYGLNVPVPMQRPYEEMNPMDRWKYITPLEHEPAETDVILGTVAAAPPLSFDPYNVSRGHSANHFDSDLQSSACLSNNDYLWGRSMASYETGMTSMVTGSTISDSTMRSYPSFNNSQAGARDRRRRRGNPTKHSKPSNKDRLFHCTFCIDSTFATKHDWQRHEKSQHLSLESWTCCLSGGTVTNSNATVCAFCDLPNPSTKHLETHNFSACQEKDLKERTFYRKDHFQQHLRLTHESKFGSAMDSWKVETPIVRSRCGFCNTKFTTWMARADHLAAHFKCRATMKDWVGDWGFEPHIAALVEHITPESALGQVCLATNMQPMPPPPVPFKDFGPIGAGEGVGGGVGGCSFQPQAFTTEEIDNILALSTSMGSSLNAGYLGLDNDIVSDWVDFGA